MKRASHISSGRRGFTILEVMLASMLGLLVVFTAIGLFGSMQISSRRSEATYQQRMELALTQEAMERAMRGFIMSGQPMPRPQPGVGGAGASGGRNANRTGTGDEGATANEPAEPAGRPRVILEVDTRYQDAMQWMGPDGRARYVTPQRLEVTLMRPPVFSPPTREELIEASLQARADTVALTERRLSQRQRERSEARAERRATRPRTGGASAVERGGLMDLRGASGGTRRSGGNGSVREGVELEELARRAGFDPGAVNRAAEAGTNTAEGGEGEGEEEDPALAPGIRGVFELQWDAEDASRARLGDPPNPDGGTWSLWWRLIDTDEVDALTEVGRGGAGLSASERRALMQERLGIDAPRRGVVRLASKLRTCRWEVVRGGETLPSFTAYYQEELPAYFTIEIQTISGEWMKWMFEVDWTRGDEPGMPIGREAQGAGGVPVLENIPIIGNPSRGRGVGERRGESTGETNRGEVRP